MENHALNFFKMFNTQQALTVAEENSSDAGGLSKAQAAYDAAYVAYHPEFAKSLSGKELFNALRETKRCPARRQSGKGIWPRTVPENEYGCKP